ncbi:protein kinase domain-containing protein [Streptacidiphilus fuscans]|uniref:non-specific serine/threonine protein kinase n=1 Tax=Streptacidiphilus fuscans TaxID=2789292 RepID=A0A931BCD6_9ACTN|nr:protein kinase [Streptacidiphilus fuscans]MBF9073627.1 serine/threonine protein kinase [Streptacidiphilus fuscans]
MDILTPPGPADDPAPALGDRYLLAEVLGSGGMAEVHRARDLRLDRTVAVKILRPALAADPVYRVRFGREARAAASLNHPGIVAVFDSGEGAGRGMDLPYLVMEYLPGRTLAQVLQAEGPLPPTLVLRVTADLLDALAHAHAHGMVHRDVKPANVMVLDDGTVKLMDFGIARSATPTDSASEGLTSTGMVVGTADYLSPEQARGEPVDARSDLYAVGCMLYELLTGRPPMASENPLDTIWRRLREDAPRPSAEVPGLSADVDALVCRALARNPADRFPDARSMRAAVEAVLAAEGDPATGAAGAAGTAAQEVDDTSARTVQLMQSAQSAPSAGSAQSAQSATVRLAVPSDPTTVLRNVSGLPTEALRHEQTVIEPLLPDAEAQSPGQPQRKRRRAGAWAGLSAVLVAGVVGGWFALGGGASAAGTGAGTTGGTGGTASSSSSASPVVASVTVPDLAHDSLAHARHTLLGLGLHLGHIRTGTCTGTAAAPRTVCSQSPAAGSALHHGGTVSLTVSRAPGLAGGTGSA